MENSSNGANGNRSVEHFTVKCKWGKSAVGVNISEHKISGMRYITANMVNQIIDQINPRMRSMFGDYHWSLEGYKGNYEMIARCKQGTFHDGRGKTPQEAFFDCSQVRGVFGSL